MCNSDGTSCGGSCDGSKADCSYPDTSTACGVACAPTTPSTALLDSFCNHSGSCVAMAPSPCPGNFACVGSACVTMCNGNTDCASTLYGCSESHLCKSFCVLDTDTVDDGCIVK
jgi:hypothetical protein